MLRVLFKPFTLAFLLGLMLIAPAALAARTILVFGDSLSAGYGLRADAAWPALLEQRLRGKGLDYSVANASISGETTSGGQARIAAALAKYRPAIVILALGANDGLRGTPLAKMRDNLTRIVRAAGEARAKVLLVGMRLPPNYGAYADDFHRVYGDIARQQKLAAVDFLLDGIAGDPRWFQPDGLHPTAEAQPRLLDTVWKGLSPLLQ